MIEHIRPAISTLLKLQVFGLIIVGVIVGIIGCLLYTSPSPRDRG